MITKITVQNADGSTQIFSQQSDPQSISIPLNTPIILTASAPVAPSTGPGTVTVQTGNITVVGVGTTFLSSFTPGNQIVVNGETRIVSSVESDTSLTTDAWSGNTTGATYTIIK